MSFFAEGVARRASCVHRDAHAANERVQRAATRALAALATRDERTKRAVERPEDIIDREGAPASWPPTYGHERVSASQAVDLGREDSRGSREEREVDDDER